MHYLYSIDDFDLKDKKVFVRTDFNVPVQQGQVSDHIRLLSALPTLKYALQKRARLIVASHRGRPQKGVASQKHLTLEPFGHYLSQHLNCDVVFVQDLHKPVPPILLSSLGEKRIVLLENLRFHPGEEAGDKQWARVLAESIDIYINEAFSVSHREHVSVSALPKLVSHKGQGLSFKKEIEVLDYLRQRAPSPFVLLAGGSKVPGKIKAISQLVDRLDFLLMGGLMAYTFLKAMGRQTGGAFVENGSLALVSHFIERLKVRGKTLLLPVDHVVTPVDNMKDVVVTDGPDIPDGFCPWDIGPKTRELFAQALRGAGTIFWNGPMGKFEEPAFAEGSMAICEAISDCDGAFRVVGGGDSISALLKAGKKDGFDYISTGGGAALRYLEQASLQGLKSLQTRQRPLWAVGGGSEFFKS